MKYPERLISDVAGHASHIAMRRITEHRVLLALGFKFRAEKGMSLTEARADIARQRGLLAPYSPGYARSIARDFGLAFPDYAPANPLNLPLE
jgi:hypothetical protein